MLRTYWLADLPAPRDDGEVTHTEAVLGLVEVTLEREGDVGEEVELQVVHGEVEVPHL